MGSRATVNERQRAICFASVSGAAVGSAAADGGTAGAGARVITKDSLLLIPVGAGWDTAGGELGGAVAATVARGAVCAEAWVLPTGAG
jgi:hypothetical protein